MRYDPQGARKVLMQADQILYLHPREFTVWERDVDIDSRIPETRQCYARVVVEHVQTASSRMPGARLSDPEQSPLALAGVSGCGTIRIARDDIADYDGRVEYWEARTETAMVVCEPTTVYHERPSQRLARLAERIAASRGSPVETFGTSDLVRFGHDGKRRVLMQADQILYLDPAALPAGTPVVDVDGHMLPDVVLEVDYSTDVRVWKLPLYEAWGFPEVWVDVPDERSHPRSRFSGLTIHVHDGERFQEAPSSRAFPGWTTEEIHVALSRTVPSAETLAVLRRVGRALGASAGTVPDDDPWLRAERAESREEGHAEGLAKGRARMVVAVLQARGVTTSPGLPELLAGYGDRSEIEMVQAAQTCADEAELVRRLGR